jgi:hypothetical protein
MSHESLDAELRDSSLARARTPNPRATIALPLMLSRGPNTPAAARPVELLIGILRTAGLSPPQAVAGMNAIASAVRGTVAMVGPTGTEPPSPEELKALSTLFPAEEFPHLSEAMLCPASCTISSSGCVRWRGSYCSRSSDRPIEAAGIAGRAACAKPIRSVTLAPDLTGSRESADLCQK